MDFVRQIVNSNTLASILDLPPSFQDVQVEVIVLPVNDKKNSLNTHDVSIKSVRHTAFGRLKAYSNPSLIPDEKGAWERAVAEKYVLH